MPNQNHAFPWGVYIGDLIDNNDTIPLCLDSKQGGFCLLFDEESETIANNLVENIALKLFEVIPIGNIVVNIFDFGKPRFTHLSALQSAKLYDIAYSSNSASSQFNAIEELANSRLHHLLPPNFETLSEYNQQSSFKEQYHLLLVNLNDFPDDMTSQNRIKNFFNSAYEAGFYTITFGSQEVLKSESKSTQAILNQFPHLSIENREFKFSKELFEFSDMLEDYAFEYVNDKRDEIVENLLSQLEKEEESSSEQDFLSVPIGMTGREEVSFNLGLKSESYSAFIAGRTGTGKSAFLNGIITRIAQNYTAKEMELYMMDYNEGGVEFYKFRNHPNCKKLFLNCGEEPQVAYEMLQEFNGYMKERAELLKSKGVSNINSYNLKYPNEKLSYKILIIDEVQDMFSKNWKEANNFNELLIKLAKTGRKFGLHFILTTQGLDSIEIDKAVINQIALRVSFRLSSDIESAKIFNDKVAYKEATKLSKHHFVYNNPQKTVVAKAYHLKDDEIANILNEIVDNRDKELVLTPEIVESQKEENREGSLSSFDQRDRENRYDTSEQKEFLKKYGFESQNFVDEGGV